MDLLKHYNVPLFYCWQNIRFLLSSCYFKPVALTLNRTPQGKILIGYLTSILGYRIITYFILWFVGKVQSSKILSENGQKKSGKTPWLPNLLANFIFRWFIDLFQNYCSLKYGVIAAKFSSLHWCFSLDFVCVSPLWE